MRQRIAWLPILAVMVAALLVLFEREWRHGEVFSPADLVYQFYPWSYEEPRSAATNPTRSDEAFYHQPLMATHFARLRAGAFPDYDDTRLSGVPAFFDGLDVGRAFSPFSLPFHLLPAEDAVNWYGPLRLLVAALAMWLFLRELGIGAIGAAAGGVAYGLNGHFLTWLSAPMPTVAAWLPLVLRQVRRCVRRGNARDVAGLALAIGALALGAYMATMLVCLLGAGVYALVEIWHARSAAHGPETPGDDARAHGHALHQEGAAAASTGTTTRGLLACVGGGVLGLALGAVALGPMLASLSDSPARARVVSAEGAEWANLATLALPDFWGTPVRGNWWHPDATASYPEHVAYFGIVVVLLAGLGVSARLSRDLSSVRWTFVGLTLLAMTRAYGAPPGRWLLALPGQAQSNPFRWYALAACGVAVLAGIGVHAWVAQADRRRRLRQLVGPMSVGLVLAAVSAAALLVYLPEIRAHHLQPFERLQVVRFVGLGTLTIALLGTASLWPSHRVRAAGGLLLVALAAGDLVQAHKAFNPSVARDRYYPSTATIDWLRTHAGDTRLAPVDTAADLVEGHVWSLFGLRSVTGFDFHGDAAYQDYLRIAQAPPGTTGTPQPAEWDHVGLHRDTLDLRMLGVLGVRYIVTAPIDMTPRAGGYMPLEPLAEGRTVIFEVPVRHEGIRGIDLLTATYARRNRGHWTWTVATDDGRVLAEGRTAQADLRDNDWWRLSWPALGGPPPRAIVVTLRGEGSDPETSATLLASASPSAIGTRLRIDGRDDARTIWFRSFAVAPDRFPGAVLVRSADLNVYENPHARPRAWFVDGVNVGDPSTHASAMHTQAFDPAREAWLAAPPSHAPASTARVVASAVGDDTRTITVDAPDGGVMLLGDRAHQGWNVQIDGRPATWTRADGVLMAVAVPPGTTSVSLQFRQPAIYRSLAVSTASLIGIVFALLMGIRRAPSVRGSCD
ncbi:MAG: hypothetical protein IT182_16140 [Acidobacteria bacterium]|nr:hypothetical protein [Acidobacteriota bacterium]